MDAPRSCALLVLLLGGPAAADTYQSVGYEVVIEAERYTRTGGTRGGPWETRTDLADFTGDGYLQVGGPDAIMGAFRSDLANVQYDIDFQQLGTYYVHLRTYAVDAAENGLFATLDGVEIDYNSPDAHYIYFPHHDADPRWDWHTEGGGDTDPGNSVRFVVSEVGLHTFALCRRNPRARVDRIWITQLEPDSFIGTEPPPLTDPAVFIKPPPEDAGLPDTGTPDAGLPDTGGPDVGTQDAGTQDAGMQDVGAQDAGLQDTEGPDVGTQDSGIQDSGLPDAGTADANSSDTAPVDGTVAERRHMDLLYLDLAGPGERPADGSIPFVESQPEDGALCGGCSSGSRRAAASSALPLIALLLWRRARRRADKAGRR